MSDSLFDLDVYDTNVSSGSGYKDDSSWFDSAGSWISDNKDWLKPVAQAGFSLYTAGQQQNKNDAYLNYMREKERLNYENTLRQQQYQLALAAARGGRGGRGGGGGGGGGGGLSKAQLDEMKALYKPFADSAQVMLPQMQEQYLSGLGALGQMQGLYSTPSAMAEMKEQPLSPMQQPLQLPGYLYK